MPSLARFFRRLPRRLLDFLISTAIFCCAVSFCHLLRRLGAGAGDDYALLIFVLAVALTSRTTEGYLFGALSSLAGVLFVNYFFTYPYFAFNFAISGYPLTFFTFLAVSLIISAATTQIKQQEALRAKAEQETLRANLLRAVSHDIRTPLTSILGASSTLLEHGEHLPPAEHIRLLTDINEDAHWLVRVVENLLSITRFSGKTALSKEPELIEDVIAESVQKFHRLSPACVEVSVPQEALLVPMDATLVEQVLLNLLENSLYHGAATHIRISVARQGSMAQVTLSDNGRGIAAEKLPTLFTDAHGSIGSTSPDSHRSMGIGLSVCRSIIRAHGGELFADNPAQGGAEFTFTLPLEDCTYENQR